MPLLKTILYYEIDSFCRIADLIADFEDLILKTNYINKNIITIDLMRLVQKVVLRGYIKKKITAIRVLGRGH